METMYVLRSSTIPMRGMTVNTVWTVGELGWDKDNRTISLNVYGFLSDTQLQSLKANKIDVKSKLVDVSGMTIEGEFELQIAQLVKLSIPEFADATIEFLQIDEPVIPE